MKTGRDRLLGLLPDRGERQPGRDGDLCGPSRKRLTHAGDRALRSANRND